MMQSEDWKVAIKAIKSSTARGSCGWAADELKNLPTCCIRDLMILLTEYYPLGFTLVYGFPSFASV